MSMLWKMYRFREDVDLASNFLDERIDKEIANALSNKSAGSILHLEKQAHALDAILKVVAEGSAKDAVYAIKTGVGVGADPGHGYQPHIVKPDVVKNIGNELSTINNRVVPDPDPQGFQDFREFEKNPQRVRVGEEIEKSGAGDPNDVEMMNELDRLFHELRDFYLEAAEKSQWILIFVV
jgi:hypothetical protein